MKTAKIEQEGYSGRYFYFGVLQSFDVDFDALCLTCNPLRK